MLPALLQRAQTSQQKQRWKHCLNKIFTTVGAQTWCKLTYCVSFFYLPSEMFLFCSSSEKSPASPLTVCVPSTFQLQSCATLLQDTSLGWTKRVSLSTSDVSAWQLPQHPQKIKIKNKPAIMVSEHGGFVASWSQLVVDVSDGCWDNEPVRDSAWPPSQPSVNEQTSHWTCHRRPSEVTSSSQRSSFTWRTVRLA